MVPTETWRVTSSPRLVTAERAPALVAAVATSAVIEVMLAPIEEIAAALSASVESEVIVAEVASEGKRVSQIKNTPLV